MSRTLIGASLVLAAGLSTAYALEPLEYSLVHGVFRPAPDTVGEGAIHPLEPLQKVEGIQNGNTFRIKVLGGVLGGGPAETVAYPVFTNASGKELANLVDFKPGSTTFLAALDLTGTGVSDIIYSNKDLSGWKILSNGARLPKPLAGFCEGFYAKGADHPDTLLIPADNHELTVDQDLLAVVGDFLGNGTEQLAYTRPGQRQMWVVGAHGVLTMQAELTGLAPALPGVKTHWLFPFKANKQGQHTRIAYYRLGADRLIRLVPKGMVFTQEQVPLKGNWERLNQAVLDWPKAAPEVVVMPSPAVPRPPQVAQASPATLEPPALEGKEPIASDR